MKNCKHCLKIATALRHTKTNKQTHIFTKTTKTFNLSKKKHIGTSFHNLLALNVKDHVLSPSPIKIDLKIGIRWFSNKFTELREKKL